MNSMEDLLVDRIVSLHKDYHDLKRIGENKQKELEELKSNFGEKNIDSLEKRVEFYQNFYIDLMLVVGDSKITFNKLFTLIDLFKVICRRPLPDDIIEFYEKNRHFCQNEIFIIKDGEIVEKEEGSLQKQREIFLKSDFLSKLIAKTDV